MATIADIIKFAEQHDISHDTPLNVYVAVEDADKSLAHADEVGDGQGALWSANPRQDHDGFQLILTDIVPRQKIT